MVNLDVLKDVRELKIKENVELKIPYGKKINIQNVSYKLFISHKYNDLLFININSSLCFYQKLKIEDIELFKIQLSKNLRINFSNYKKELSLLFFYENDYYKEENGVLKKLLRKDYRKATEIKDFILIKSKQRVKDLAEVYTNEREVNAMLDLVKEYSYDIKRTFLEPACGNGNFLIKILERKIQTMKEMKTFKKGFSPKITEYFLLRCVSNIYGIDICEENVYESKERLKNCVINEYNNLIQDDMSFDFEKSLDYVLNRTIVVGDTLNAEENIFFSQFTVKKQFVIAEKVFCFKDLYDTNPKPTKVFKEVQFLKLYENEFIQEKGNDK